MELGVQTTLLENMLAGCKKRKERDVHVTIERSGFIDEIE